MRPLVLLGLLLALAAGGWWSVRHWSETPSAESVMEPTPAVSIEKVPSEAQPAPTAMTAAAAPELKVAASVRGYRASQSERASYTQRLSAEANLVALSKQLVTQAQGGDADAAATLADLHQTCSSALESVPQKPRAQPAALAQNPPAPSPAELMAQRCAGFGEPGSLTGYNLRGSAEAWSVTAARLGHAPSILKDLSRQRVRTYGPIGPQELGARAAAEELLREGDYAALAANVDVLASLGGHQMSDAWSLVLCELATSCSSGSPCGRVCSYRRQRPGDLAPRQRRELAGKQLAILQALQTGQYAPLWRPTPTTGDGS